jgi:hypothetical protein
MITTDHKLLTDQWTCDVETVERAIGRMSEHRAVTNPCRVVLFEVARDGQLHVNVTHARKTKAIRGWAGPARVAGGFVNNRTFGDQPERIAGHIREMVFAATV